MTLNEFAQMLDGREYLHEITKEEEALAKELGFVVVFGYSDDNAELRGAIDDELGCFDGGELEHEDLPDKIYADWCPKEEKCSWAYRTSIPHKTFRIYDEGELYCVGIVCDINKSPMTNGDQIRAMSDDELAKIVYEIDSLGYCENLPECEKLLDSEGGIPEEKCIGCILAWLRQPAKEET